MKALVYHGPGRKAWEEVPDPVITADTDAIVKVDAVTICGTDLHILKGDVPEVRPGTVLGHEAVGEVVETGADVRTARPGTVRLGRGAGPSRQGTHRRHRAGRRRHHLWHGPAHSQG